jgi:hypothetical protein
MQGRVLDKPKLGRGVRRSGIYGKRYKIGFLTSLTMLENIVGKNVERESKGESYFA